MTDEFGEIEKLTEIEKLDNGSSQNIDRLLELSHDSDNEVRYRSIETFENFDEPTEAILSRVREGLNDENEIVRTTSIELLGDWEDVDSIEMLYSALDDESDIVRGAALTSLGQMGRKDIIEVVEEKYPGFEGIEKVSAAIALYSLGEKRYLDDLLSFLDDDYYLIRCRTANSLCRFVDEQDKAKVIEKMEFALAIEKTVAAASSLSNAITELEDEMEDDEEDESP
jgi:HEAT repeat protein